MVRLVKRPIIIQDLIAYASYIGVDNLDASDRFLLAAEATFLQLTKTPKIGRISGFVNPKISQVRQVPIKGFKNYFVFYQIQAETVDVIRILHSAQNIENILEAEIPD
jgi:toxin ParE1/3/4